MAFGSGQKIVLKTGACFGVELSVKVLVDDFILDHQQLLEELIVGENRCFDRFMLSLVNLTEQIASDVALRYAIWLHGLSLAAVSPQSICEFDKKLSADR